MSEENAEVTVETTETVESLKAALSKAEAKIVDMKKSTTPAEKLEEATIAPTGFDDNAFEKKYEEKKFFEANPDMLEYKDKLTEKTALGNSWADAKMLVESSDETIANRKIASQTNFTSGDAATGGQAVYTMEEFAEIGKHNPKRYAELLKDAKDGKVRVGT